MRSVGDDVEKKEPLHTVQKNGHLYSHQGNEDEGSSKNLKIELLYYPVMPSFPGYVSKGNEIRTSKTHLHSRVHSSTIDGSQAIESTLSVC